MKKNININKKDKDHISGSINWLDKAICVISPAWGYKRIAWRSNIRSAYNSAHPDRTSSALYLNNNPAEQTNQQSRDTIRSFARHLERNSDIAEAVVNSYERNVVGTGLKLQVKIVDKDGKENDKLNQLIEEQFKNWSRARNCDITEQLSFVEIQAMVMRRMIVDGGILLIKTYTGGKLSLIHI